eukprot:UC4_evm1s908
MSRRNVSLFFQTRLPQAVTAQNQHFDQPHREDEAQETPETTEEPTTTTREADADKDQNQSESLDGLISNLKDLLLETLPRREVVADSSSVASPCAGITCIIYDLDIGIVEVGAIAAEYTPKKKKWICSEEFQIFVKPKKSISKSVPHNISEGELKHARLFQDECKAKLEGFIAKYAARKQVIMAAHNGKRYDHRILEHHGFLPGKDVKFVDTLDVFKKCLPNHKSYSIKNLF